MGIKNKSSNKEVISCHSICISKLIEDELFYECLFDIVVREIYGRFI